MSTELEGGLCPNVTEPCKRLHVVEEPLSRTKILEFDDDKPTTKGVTENNVIQKIRYPYSVFVIISNELCERFNYYGMRTILSLYLTNILLYEEKSATIVYHSFINLAYFFPIVGGIISDSFLGKFRTIFYVSIVYAAGSIILALASADPLQLPKEPISILGLLLIAIGTGGIKPCVAAFGGDQFVLPQQEKQLASFFSLYYFTMNMGNLISSSSTPKLREMQCLGSNSCYPLAFAIPGFLMVLSIIIFGLGKRLYKIKQPEGNIIVQVSKCIGHAVYSKIKSDKNKEHWLDHSKEKYGLPLVSDIKASLKVLVMFLPVPMAWALFDQQGSAWTFQAVRMSGDIGFYTILPDQMQVIDPLLILILIPLFEYGIYPLLAKFNLLKTPLQRMACGGFLTVLAFVISALISIVIESTDPVFPGTGVAQLRLYNPSKCDVIVKTNHSGLNEFAIESMHYKKFTDLKLGQLGQPIQFEYKDCNGKLLETVTHINDSTCYLIYFDDKELQFLVDDITKNTKGLPVIRALYGISNNTKSIESVFRQDQKIEMRFNNSYLQRLEVTPGDYESENLTFITLKQGGVYTILLDSSADDKFDKLITVTEPNSVNMLLLIPQYVLITTAEVLFAITAISFSYSQAPTSMKALIQAFYLLTVAFGNLIIVIIEAIQMFDKASNDMFLYSGLMIVNMLLFVFLAKRYKYLDVNKTKEVEINKELEKCGTC